MITGKPAIDIHQLPFPVAVFLKNGKTSDPLAFKLSEFNEAFEALSALKVDSFSGLPEKEKEKYGLANFFSDKNLLNGGKSFVNPMEYFCLKNKKWYNVNFSNDNQVALFAFFTDITPQKQQIEKLEESNKKNLLLSDATLEGVLLHKEGRIVDLNLSLLKLFGYEKEEVIGRNVLEFISENHHERAKTNIAKDAVTPYELALLTKSGESIVAEIQGYTIRLNGENIRVTLIRDRTEKRKIENYLRESRAKYKRITDNMTDVVWIADLHFNTTYISPSVKKVLGDTPEHHMKRDIAEKYPPDTIRRLTQIFEEQLLMESDPEAEKNRNVIVETQHYKPDGSVIWVSENISFIRDEDGKPNGFLGVLRDISERKALENELIESERKYRGLIENSYEIHYKINQEGVINYVSPAWTRFLGHNLSAVEKRKVFEFLHPDDIPGVILVISEAFKKGERIENLEYRVKHKNGQWMWHATSASPLKDETGKVVELLGVASDITDKKKVQNDLNLTERLYRESIDNNSDLIFVKDENLTYLVVNNALAGFFGLEKEQILGKTDLDLMGEEGCKTCLETDKKAMHSSKPFTFEETIGDQVFETIKFAIDMGNDKKGLVGFIRDITKQRDLSNQIRSKTKLLQNITDNMFDLVALTDPEGHFTFLSKSNEKFGYPLDELLGKHVFSSVHQDDLAYIKSSFDQAMQTGQEGKVEYRYRCANGSYLWVETMGKVITDQEGKVNGLLFSSRDITERKKMESALRESESTLKAIIENPFESIWSINKSGEIQYVNELFATAFQQFFGKELDNGVKIMNMLPVELQNSWKEKYHKVFSGERFVFEEIYPHPSQNQNIYSEIYANPVYLDDEVVGACFYGRDITERKRAEQKLKKLSALQNILVKIASEYINLDLKDFESSVSRSLQQLGEFVNADRSYIFEYDWKNQCCNNIYEWCAQGIEPEIENLQQVPLSPIPEWVNAHQQNKPLYIKDVFQLPEENSVRKILEPQGVKSLMTIPITDKNECIGFIGFDSVKNHHFYQEEEKNLLAVYSQIYVNLKNKSELERSLIQEKEKANAANRAKSEFLANISHEIRTPMNSILGFSEVMMNTTNDSKQKNYLKTILDSGKTLLSLINDILDLSKIEAGKIEISPEPVDLRVIIDEIKQLFHHKMEEKNITFRVNIDDDFPHAIVIDEVRLRQVLLNLVGNAIKFTDEGFVGFDVRLLQNMDNCIDFEIVVSDSGIGIAEEEQKQIFESFTQTSGQDSKKYGGTGLGLAISKRLIELMNGNILLESTIGKGSDFIVRLRNVKYSNNIVEQNELYLWNENRIDFEPATVLVVDDIMHNRQLVMTYLENYNLKIFEAENGEMAVESAKAYHPDLIFMDIRMPGMNGYEATKRIKSDPDVSDIPVVALTASTMQSEIDELKHTFDGYLRKPIQKKSLVNEMTKFLKFSENELPEDLKTSENEKHLFFTQVDIDVKTKEDFQRHLKDRINDQIDFITLDELTILKKELDDFALKYKILNLKVLNDELGLHIDDFDFEKTQNCLIRICKLFD